MGNPSSIFACKTPGPAPRQRAQDTSETTLLRVGIAPEVPWRRQLLLAHCPRSWLRPALVPYSLCQLEPWGSCCWFHRSTNSPVQIQMKASPSQGRLVPGVSDSSLNSFMESWKGHFMILPIGLSHRCPSTHALLNSEPEVPTALSQLFLLMTKMDLPWCRFFMEVSFDIRVMQ